MPYAVFVILPAMQRHGVFLYISSREDIGDVPLNPTLGIRRYVMTHHTQPGDASRANRARIQRWRTAHPEVDRHNNQIRRTRKHALPFFFSLNEEAFCRSYFHYACAVCGNEEGFQWTIAMDHWIPLKATDCPGTLAANMIPLCHGRGGCNNSKKNKDPEPWLIKRFGPSKARHILKKIHSYFATVAMQEQAS